VEERKTKRKLAAILSADVKGYSILMADDEAATVRTLTAYRDLISALTRKHQGRVVDSPGDNLLAEFLSVVDAVRCAVEIQEELKTRNADLNENRRMVFRIGIHLGDIIQEGTRIYGDGVNIAARIEGLAEAGGICISRSAYDQVRNKLSLEYENLGEHTVKNISEPVRVYRVVLGPDMAGDVLPGKKKRRAKRWLWAAVGAVVLLLGISAGIFWNYYYLPAPVDIDPEGKMAFALPEGPSIAVLPFNNMSGDPSQDYFCDGITENIISALSHSSMLFVIARNSTFAYKGKSIDVRKAGRELGARYVLEGSIQKTGERIRITAQLIDAKSGNHLWSERYDRDLKDIFALQDEITLKIMMGLGVELGGEGFRSRVEGINNLDVLQKLTQAVGYLSCMNKEDNVLARQKAEEIIAIDPDIAVAYVLIGLTHIMDLGFGTSPLPLVSLGKATEAARKAVTLDDNNSDAHLLMSHIFLMRKEHEKAITEAKRAIALNPNSADAYEALGVVLSLSDREVEAIGFIKKAIRLNPFPPGYYLNFLGVAYTGAKQYEEAIEAYKKSIKREPNCIFPHINLAWTYSLMGREKDAHEAALDVLKIDPDFSLKNFAKTSAFKNQDKKERAMEALRKAGLK
jgi:adenylate cyclase